MNKANGEDTYIFKPETWQFVVTVFALFLGGFLFLIPVILALTPYFPQAITSESFVYLLIEMTCSALPFLMMDVVFIFSLSMKVISLYYSYIEINSKGMEFNYWPMVHIFIRWEDIDHLYPYKSSRHTLYFKRFTKLGRAISYPGIFIKLQGGSGSIPIRYLYSNPKTSIYLEMKKHIKDLT